MHSSAISSGVKCFLNFKVCAREFLHVQRRLLETINQTRYHLLFINKMITKYVCSSSHQSVLMETRNKAMQIICKSDS